MKLEQKIIQKVGENSIGTGNVANEDLEFAYPITFSDGTEALSFYTYKGKVCVLNNIGDDKDFDSYSIQDQTLIYNALIEKNL